MGSAARSTGREQRSPVWLIRSEEALNNQLVMGIICVHVTEQDAWRLLMRTDTVCVRRVMQTV